MKKYITGAAMALGLSTFPAAVDASFSDVSIYQDEIDYLTERNIIQGYDNDEFRPNNTVTRLQAVQMILRGLQVEPDGENSAEFSDINAGDYGYDEISAAVELGIISGKTNSKTGEQYFDPYAPLTRSQMAKILTNAYALEEEWNYFFADISHDHWAKDYVDTLASHGISTGYEDRTFRPDQQIKRSHFALFMARMLDDRFVEGDVMENVSYMPDPKDYVTEDENFRTTYEFLDFKEDSSQYWKVSREDLQEYSMDFGEISVSYVGYKETAEGLFSKDAPSVELFDSRDFLIELPYPLENGEKFQYLYTYDGTVHLLDSYETDGQIYKNVVYIDSSGGPNGNELIDSYYAPNKGYIDGEFGYAGGDPY
ncbi:S-layer homology domain-containing protein [Jeotgalibacillus salarius]|uniref:S-layer homology domain-containing protein n=1 Tax=Jeotgalibacillus salarius TaxID=546023 RepID=A0A4Y8LN65_9BACL|nr:S-layer homology domain-containing protein [Jeotgalibacillus salarius]TFE04033.1 S-layer homology domain-containing protein [Jeotgalibacillus salarius]